jgi:hypothetical protein
MRLKQPDNSQNHLLKIEFFALDQTDQPRPDDIKALAQHLNHALAAGDSEDRVLTSLRHMMIRAYAAGQQDTAQKAIYQSLDQITADVSDTFKANAHRAASYVLHSPQRESRRMALAFSDATFEQRHPEAAGVYRLNSIKGALTLLAGTVLGWKIPSVAVQSYEHS